MLFLVFENSNKLIYGRCTDLNAFIKFMFSDPISGSCLILFWMPMNFVKRLGSSFTNVPILVFENSNKLIYGRCTDLNAFIKFMFSDPISGSCLILFWMPTNFVKRLGSSFTNVPTLVFENSDKLIYGRHTDLPQRFSGSLSYLPVLILERSDERSHSSNVADFPQCLSGNPSYLPALVLKHIDEWIHSPGITDLSQRYGSILAYINDPLVL